ncbi:MAG: hypothetical protein KBD78_06455 [Oligoflexales bacterium]|nr:hypothetical protein [Oligoflexales bacterium]
MLLKGIKIAVLALTFQSATALADATKVDTALFASLDAEYAKRGEWIDNNAANEKNFLDLIAAYDKLITDKKLSGDNLFYAVGQANRLVHFYGDSVLTDSEVDQKKRISVFKACVDRTNKNIDTKKLSAEFQADIYRNQYTYWRMSCLAFQAEFSHLIDKVKLAAILIDIRDNELDLEVKLDAKPVAKIEMKSTVGNICYEAGGILRTFSGVYSNEAAKSVNLFRPDESVVLAQQALNQAANQVAYCTLSGADDLSNTLYYAEALIAAGKNSKIAGEEAKKSAEAKAYIENTVICKFLTDDSTGDCDLSSATAEAAYAVISDVNVAEDKSVWLNTGSLPEARADLKKIFDLYNTL